MKKNKTNIGVRFIDKGEATISYAISDGGRRAAQSYVVHAIFLLSTLRMAGGFLNMGHLQAGAVAWLAGTLAVLAVCFEVAIPVLFQRAKPYFVYLVRLTTAALLGLLAFQRFAAYYRENQLDLEDGFLWLGGIYVEKYNSYYHTGLRLPEGKEAYMMQACVYLLLIVLLVQFLLSQLLRTNICALLLPVGVLVAELLVGETPDLKGMLLFSASCIFWTVGKQLPLRRQLAAVALWSVLFVAVSHIFTAPAQGLVAKAPQYKQYQKAIESRISQIRVSDIWTDRERVTNQSPAYNDKKILTITADAKVSGNLYLKAFTGADYDNGSWTMAPAELAKACEAENLDSAQMEDLLWNEASHTFRSLQDVATPAHYTVSYSSHLREDALVPYFSDLTDNEQLSMDGDTRIEKSVFSQTTSVDGINANDSINELRSLLISYLGGSAERYWNWYANYVKEQYLQTDAGVAAAGEYAKQCYDKATVTKTVMTTNERRIRLADAVSAFLCRQYTYSWNLDAISDGTDPVEYFLATGKKGYCMHFASAGTLMLRELGVPARYAAGYVVKESAFQKNADGTYTATVADRNAHAWTEIYLEQIGWVPVEMTAGYAKTLSALPTEEEEVIKREAQELAAAISTQESETQTGVVETQKTETQTQPESQTQDAQPDTKRQGAEGESQIAKAAEPVDSDSTGADAAAAGEKSSGSNAERGAEMTDRDLFIYLLKKNLRVLLCVFMVCVFVVCGAFVPAPTYRHRDVRSHQERLARDFHEKDYRHAVRLMNRRINRRLKKDTRFGVTWKTDLEYEKLLCQTYRKVDEVTWKSYMRVVKKAAYSNEQPTADEAILCYDVYKRILYLGFRR